MTLPWLAHVQLATTLFGKSALCDVTKITDTSPRLLTTQQGVGSAHFAPRAPCFCCSTCKHVQGGREHSFLAGDWKHTGLIWSQGVGHCRNVVEASSPHHANPVQWIACATRCSTWVGWLRRMSWPLNDLISSFWGQKTRLWRQVDSVRSKMRQLRHGWGYVLARWVQKLKTMLCVCVCAFLFFFGEENWGLDFHRFWV